MKMMAQILLTVHCSHPLLMRDRAMKGITPAPTSRSLMARFMISTDVTEWKVLVAATMTMTRILPTPQNTYLNNL